MTRTEPRGGEPCGGCGEHDPRKACLGCLHFQSRPAPLVVHGRPDRENPHAELFQRLDEILVEESPMHPFGCATWLDATRIAIDMAKDALSGPVDPTPAMIDAGCKVGGWGFTPELDREAAAATYRAMRVALTDGVGE